MKNSLLEQRSFTELIKLRDYFQDMSQTASVNFEARAEYKNQMKNIENVIWDKYRYEATTQYSQDPNPGN